MTVNTVVAHGLSKVLYVVANGTENGCNIYPTKLTHMRELFSSVALIVAVIVGIVMVSLTVDLYSVFVNISHAVLSVKGFCGVRILVRKKNYTSTYSFSGVVLGPKMGPLLRKISPRKKL